VLGHVTEQAEQAAREVRSHTLADCLGASGRLDAARLPMASSTRCRPSRKAPDGAALLTPEQRQRYARHLALAEVGREGQQRCCARGC